jgi:hypothetical protein
MCRENSDLVARFPQRSQKFEGHCFRISPNIFLDRPRDNRLVAEIQLQIRPRDLRNMYQELKIRLVGQRSACCAQYYVCDCSYLP